MKRRKVSFKRYKTENTNREVGLYAGKPLPFSIGSVRHEYPLPPTKPRYISKEEFFALVKENEQMQRKKNKRK
jgi:hypothetical protein